MSTQPDHRNPPGPAAGDDPAIDPALLDVLLRQPEPVTIETLSLRIKKTTRQVHHELDRLRDNDCRLDEHPQRGVALRRCGLGTWADYLRWSCREHPQRNIEVYRQTTSTQDAARRIAESRGKTSDGSVAVADEQTAGRGRLGRRWLAPPGTAVTFSRVCIVDRSRLSIDRLMLAATVAVARAVEPWVQPKQVQVRWPNDLLIDGKKTVGILVETFPLLTDISTMAAVIGVGINVSLDPKQFATQSPELVNQVTSLAAHGRPVDRLLVLASTLQHLDRCLAETDLGSLVAAWRDRCPMLTKQVSLRSDGRTVRGQVVDLDPSAGLIVRTDAGTLVHLPAATTSLLPS